MKKLILTLLLAQTPLLLASKPNLADYALTVHVQCSFGRPNDQRLGVSLNGKSIELSSVAKSQGTLVLGDYKARLLRDQSKNAYDVQQTYELLLPDGNVRSFQVIGFGPGVCSVPPR